MVKTILDKKKRNDAIFPIKFLIKQSNSKCPRISISDRILLKFTLSIDKDVFHTNVQTKDIDATDKHILGITFKRD